ncbi:hypothetical protein BBI17_004340 [Phytophthora kernoviae]|uniref:Amino acid permease/ SLC12A domain-containing protein n=1 Tax=Phytophthora kernoviae TaxID=325452 RepID=A0A421FA28_9STRA|nr:hypothetical protein BBI17_004340 [Phytophthora kernoviae]
MLSTPTSGRLERCVEALSDRSTSYLLVVRWLGLSPCFCSRSSSGCRSPTLQLNSAPRTLKTAIWVLNAFGPFWAFQTGYWAWVSGVIDNAIYPALAVSSFTDVYGSIGSPTAEYFIKAAIAVVLALPNLLGIQLVGNGMAGMSIFVMVPFVVLFIWGMVRASDWGVLGEVRRSDIVYDADGDFVSMSGSIDIDWSLLINTLFWNFNGAVGMSVFGSEVKNPGHTYPRALLLSVLLVALTYLLPLFGSTVYNSPSWTTWEDGSFSGIAHALGGTFLSTWVMLATFCSNAGMYIAELFCDSFQIMGMSQCGLAPAFLKARNKRFNTPHNAVFASLVVIFVLIQFDFEDIQNMTNALSAFYQLLILVAFVKLRYTHADIDRPFKVPGRISVIIVSLLIPAGLLVYIAVDVFFTLAPAMIVLGVTLVGIVYAWAKKFTRAQFQELDITEG